MNTIFNYIKLIRPLNCLFTAIVVIVGGLLSINNLRIESDLLLASFAAFLVAGSGNVINDIFDFNIDKIVHPERPIANGLINKINALKFYLVLSITAIFLSLFISIKIFFIVVISIIVLYLYSSHLKKIPLLGNTIVAFMTSLAFLFGGFVVENVYATIIPAVFAFMINLIRELVKDMEDIEGDLKNDIITFPAKFGIQKTRLITLFISVALIVFTIYPFLSQIYSIEYFLIVMIIVNPLLVYAMKKFSFAKEKSELHTVSTLLKISMLFGLIAIYLGR